MRLAAVVAGQHDIFVEVRDLQGTGHGQIGNGQIDPQYGRPLKGFVHESPVRMRIVAFQRRVRLHLERYGSEEELEIDVARDQRGLVRQRDVAVGKVHQKGERRRYLAQDGDESHVQRVHARLDHAPFPVHGRVIRRPRDGTDLLHALHDLLGVPLRKIIIPSSDGFDRRLLQLLLQFDPPGVHVDVVQFRLAQHGAERGTIEAEQSDGSAVRRDGGGATGGFVDQRQFAKGPSFARGAHLAPVHLELDLAGLDDVEIIPPVALAHDGGAPRIFDRLEGLDQRAQFRIGDLIEHVREGQAPAYKIDVALGLLSQHRTEGGAVDAPQAHPLPVFLILVLGDGCGGPPTIPVQQCQFTERLSLIGVPHRVPVHLESDIPAPDDVEIIPGVSLAADLVSVGIIYRFERGYEGGEVRGREFRERIGRGESGGYEIDVLGGLFGSSSMMMIGGGGIDVLRGGGDEESSAAAAAR
mmetsp:Transcript_43764/g.133179  ORF Transcript_43764/g.133179 Transcript_43764/m.133179 type:complete len:469 (-) Transcript_43764:145-1551(-)